MWQRAFATVKSGFVSCGGAGRNGRIELRDLCQYWTERQTGGAIVAERHLVKCQDDIWIVMHRIAFSDVKKTRMPNEKSVFMLHGLYESSANWIFSGTDALPFHLARKGFDVWLGNTRGNLFTSTTDPRNSIYGFEGMSEAASIPEATSTISCDCLPCQSGGWESKWRLFAPSFLYASCKNRRKNDIVRAPWTFREIAMLDLPIMLQYIKDMTKQMPICIGVSQGAAQLTLFAHASGKMLRNDLSTGFITEDVSSKSATPSQETVCSLDNGPKDLTQTGSKILLDGYDMNALIDSSTSKAGDLLPNRLILFSPALGYRDWGNNVGPVKSIIRCAKMFNSGAVRFANLFSAMSPQFFLSIFGKIVMAMMFRFYRSSIKCPVRSKYLRHTPNGETSEVNLSYFLNLMMNKSEINLIKDDDTQPVSLPIEIYVFGGSEDTLTDPVLSAQKVNSLLNPRKLKFSLFNQLSHLDFHWSDDRVHDVYPSVVSICEGECLDKVSEMLNNVADIIG